MSHWLDRFLCFLQIYTVFLNMMTAAHSMEACEEVFTAGAQWFEAWAGAGQGDVDAAEMTIIVQQVRSVLAVPCKCERLVSCCRDDIGAHLCNLLGTGMIMGQARTASGCASSSTCINL